MTNINQNGMQVSKNVRREADGTWSAVVWSGAGTISNPARNIQRRYGYRTRQDARNADISEMPR